MPYFPVSPQFEAALLAGHHPVVKVDALLGGTVVKPNIPVADGSVSYDRGSQTRRTLSLTVADPGLLPWDPTDPLGVYGQQLVVQAGIQYPSGSTEWVPLGTFTIDDPDGDVDGLDNFTLSGSSSEVLVQNASFTTATTTVGFASSVQAITQLIQAAVPGATVVNLTSDGRNPALPPQTWDAGSSRWDAVTQIAQAMAAEVGCDQLDRFVITDIPDPSTATAGVWDITYGGVLLKDTRQMSRSGMANGILVTGDNASAGSAPVAGLATDDDPTSPTRWGGPLGQILKPVQSSLVTTSAAAALMARSLLRDALAPNIVASVDVIPHPGLDCSDIVRLVHGNGRKEFAAIQSGNYPFALEGSSTLTMRGAHTDDGGGS